MISVLVVDDERPTLDAIARALRVEGYDDVTTTTNPREALSLVEKREFDIALLDINMPGMDGLDVLRKIKEIRPGTECIMLTANASIPTVITAVKIGAYDYLLKPLRPDQLMQAFDRALERKRLIASLMLRSETRISSTLEQPEAFAEIVAGCRRMLQLLREVELHAASKIPVLLTGETGVGKELIARAIHRASPRADRPFIAINMLALSPTLFESEFFGHAKGAFTGADRERAGYLARAGGGTLFLDEIGDLSLEIQGKLLRILQEDEFYPVGRTRPERANVRFVAATNQDLPSLVEERRFRADLFYRLQFAHLTIPPLRDRLEDVQLLAAKILSGLDRSGVRLSDEAEIELVRHDWPGNVRELRGVLEAAANLAEKGVIEPEHLRLSSPLGHKPERTTLHDHASKLTSKDDVLPLAEVEKSHIVETYRVMGRNKTHTARALGIGLQTLHRKLKAYGVK